MRGATTALIVLLCVAACGRSDDVLEAYAAYVDALAGGDFDAAFALLSAESVDALERRRSGSETRAAEPLARIEADDHESRLRDARSAREAFRALIAGPNRTPPLTRAAVEAARPRVISRGDREATVEATAPLGPVRSRWVREAAGWRLRLEGI
jgi:hypothetical protein